MVAGAALRERSFAEVKRLCYGGLDAATLLRSVATRLKRVVPFEAYCAQTNDPLSGLLTHVINDGAILGEKEHSDSHECSSNGFPWSNPPRRRKHV